MKIESVIRMMKNNFSITDQLETILSQINSISFLKVLLVIFPVSMFVTFFNLLASDVAAFIMYTFFEQ